jgi:FMNH2-dependent dimethyl sulfone monooxygenase
MRYGYWLPVFGGWLRNVENENMEASWSYVKKLAQRSEQIGFDLTLIAELNLNDIKGVEAPSLDAWSTAAALAAVTERIELMVAVRPTFHLPALLAKQAANIDRISHGRLTLNVVSSWWEGEARKYGVAFEKHDDRYARTSEWLDVLDGAWQQNHFSYSGKYYRVDDNVLEPKPVAKPRPTLYAGGESPAAKELIAQKCDAYLMHGDSPERVGEKIKDLRQRRVQKRMTKCGASPTCSSPRQVTQTIRNGWVAHSSSNAFRWKIIRYRTAGCVPGWSAHPKKLRNVWPNLKGSA